MAKLRSASSTGVIGNSRSNILRTSPDSTIRMTQTRRRPDSGLVAAERISGKRLSAIRSTDTYTLAFQYFSSMRTARRDAAHTCHAGGIAQRPKCQHYQEPESLRKRERSRQSEPADRADAVRLSKLSCDLFRID